MTPLLFPARRGDRLAGRRLGHRRRLAAEQLRRPQRRLDDVLVAGAAAQVARQRLADLALGRAGVLLEIRLDRQQEARRAEAALEAVALPERLLDRVEGRDALQTGGREALRPGVGGQPLDGQELVA